MNKEELKKTLWNGFKSWEIFSGVETEMVFVPKQALFDLIDQLDEQKPEVLIAERTVEKEPEKPVVPSFVAEWHEKNEFENWWNWLYKWGKEPIKDELEKRVHDWFIDYHEYDFVDMHRIGYTAEDKKYYVLDNYDAAILYRNMDKEFSSTIAYPCDGRLLRHVVAQNEEYLYQFTEKEIKGYDERYWPFAEEVTE